MAAAPTLAPIPAHHQVDEVTVYREGARVRRTMTVTGERETPDQQLRFAGLPLGLDDGSVRTFVECEGDLAAVDARVVLEAPEPDTELAAAEDESLKAARLAFERQRHHVARLEQALARLESLKVAPRPPLRDNEPALAIPLEGRQKLVAVRVQESERVAKELANARVEARTAERKLTEEVERHKRATTARNAKRHELRKAIVVRLEGKAKGTAKVSVEYLVPGACWSPSYALVLDGAKAKLTMRALVAQRTGEDWKGARLVLSTAQADRWIELPELPKARIGRAQPRPRKRGYREPPEGALALYADYDRAMGGPPRESTPPAAPLDEEPTPPQFALAKQEVAGPRGFGGAPPPPAAPMVTRAGAIRSEPELVAAPAPAAMPAGMPAQVLAARSRSSGVAGVIGRLAAAIPSSGSSGGERSMPMAKGTATLDDGVLGEPIAASELEETTRWPGAAPARVDWELDAEAMAYGRLRMRGADDPARGELVAIASAQLYVEQLEGKLAVGVSVTAVLAAAHDTARIDTGRLPSGYALAASEDSYDYAYVAEMPADVPADGAFHTIAVASYESKSSLRYVAVPREGQQVFRLLDLESPIDGALLAGPLDVYESEGEHGELAYRTTTRMPQTPPRGRVEIGLGVEPAIKVARSTSFQEETTGLLGGSLALGHRIKVELRNLLPRAVNVEVRERVPVVRKDDAEVKVEVGQVEPAWERWDQEQTLRGGYLWKVALEPGESKNLSARYTIKIASKHELAGGNRRES